MKLTINGQTKNISNAATVADLAAQFCPNRKSIIAEINGAIVPCGQWDKTILKEGDAVELVAFVGGG
ncbi:MAG: sulfur carrier protein ThiS [Candidatus Omnitrophica bacterium]|nr:sulfur carrier protein ThiS [Candidatus Omnitrophota bacterium]